MTLAEVAAAVGGELRDADPDTLVTRGVEYDSRRVGAGDLFLALPGERVDGHDFAAAALDRGAVAVLASRDVATPRIIVADGVAAITDLAAVVARRLSATIVGITGSSGKTSTKDLLAHVLARAGPTVAAAGSANNELGHPHTVLRATADTRFLVLELGARGLGHIAHLARVAPPQVGVVLNVGSAHLGEFGSREAIAQAKGELVEALPAGGLAVLNADDPLTLAMLARTSARVVTFGAGDADVCARDVAIDDLGRPSFDLVAGGETRAVRLRLVGAHHVSNALAAAAVALSAGMAPQEIAAALSSAEPASRWRMELTERPDGVVVVNDAYNANPESMAAALRAVAGIAERRGGRAVAALGQMAELGPAATDEHEAIGRLAAQLGFARVVAVGDSARPIAEAAALEGSRTGRAVLARAVADLDHARAELREQLRAGDVVLIKASRAASLERLAVAVIEDGGAGASAAPERGAGPGTEKEGAAWA